MDITKKIITEGKYTLSKPLYIQTEHADGNASTPIEITELNLPFLELRGRDIVEAQEEFVVLNGRELDVFEANKGFHVYLISRMSKVPYDTIMDEMAVHDFSVVTLTAYRFLTRGV